jgi:hypothetical protein
MAAKVSKGPYLVVAFLAFLAALLGLLLGSEARTLANYAALPVSEASEIIRMPVGKMVRLEGRAHSEPPLLMADGSALAMQVVKFRHRMGSRDTTDYNGTLPASFILGNEVTHKTDDEIRVLTQRINPDFSSRAPIQYRLEGTPADVTSRIATAISPAFVDYHYVRGDRSWLYVTSFPQDSKVTVCGVIEPPGSDRSQLGARCADPLVGREFSAHALTSSRQKGKISTAVLGAALLVLGLDGFFYYRYRRRKQQR